MELDELTRAWRALDAQLAAQSVELRASRHDHGIDAARSRLRGVTLGQWLQLAVGVAVAIFAGGYWWDHLGTTHLVAYGVGLHLYGIALIVAASLQLTGLLRLDYRAPVFDVQRRLLALRRLRARCERGLLMLGFVAWVPLVFIAMRAVGMDVWVQRPGVVLANLAVGLAMAGCVAWLTLRHARRFEHDSAGGSLRAAEAELAAISDGDATLP
jgi:hypothetical protein